MSNNQKNQSFSFLEFNDILNKQYIPQDSEKKKNIIPPQTQSQKLKFEPNLNVARIQGSDQLHQSTVSQKNDQERKTDLIQDSNYLFYY